AGDREAFERLFALYRPGLCRFIRLRLDARLRARVDVSDVVQEAQLDALRRLADFLERRPMPFHLWLRETAYGRLVNVRRHHVETARRAVGRERALPDRSSLLLAAHLLAGGPSPSEQVARREAARRVNDALAGLPEEDREVLLMRSLEGLSYQEVGCTLAMDPAAARRRYGRALLRLRKALFDNGPPESLP